ncbi:MAG: tetratricopeptide repeat protein [Mediterranea sp.]|jgi:tetratricopeptide (TPR) repeat protein|nr:tetratricopeptide repeat protein [Mediterranea sp.]
MKKTLFFIFALSATIHTLAQEQAKIDSVPQRAITKAEGDSAFMRNDYASAIQIYETLLEGGEAAAIYYNLGNSYFKTDNISKAIVNYERALLLQPGNEDIRANLEIARSKTVDKIDVIPDVFFVSWIKDLRNSESVDGWGRYGIVFFILFVVALYLFVFSKKAILKKSGLIGGFLFLMVVIVVNVFASQQQEIFLNRDKAIVVSPSVTVRNTPSDSGTTLFVLHEGSKVIISDGSMREWKRIRLEDGKVGWVPASNIEII